MCEDSATKSLILVEIVRYFRFYFLMKELLTKTSILIVWLLVQILSLTSAERRIFKSKIQVCNQN